MYYSVNQECSTHNGEEHSQEGNYLIDIWFHLSPYLFNKYNAASPIAIPIIIITGKAI